MLNGIEENVDTAVVARWADTTNQVLLAPEGAHFIRSMSNQNAESHARVGDMRSGKVKVGALKLYGLQRSILLRNIKLIGSAKVAEHVINSVFHGQ
jgi:hypothetical protein